MSGAPQPNDRQQDRRAKPSIRLITYRSRHGERAGILDNYGIRDVAAFTGDVNDSTVEAMLLDWGGAIARLRGALESKGPNAAALIDDAELLAPLPRPSAIYCAGANYSDHSAEMAKAGGGVAPTRPDRSWHFLKSPHAVVGPDAIVNLPSNSKMVDWEVELAVIIGRKCKDVALNEALDCVAGYSIAIDLSARDLSRRTDVPDSSPFKMDWLAHKNFDGSCPLGPYLVPADEIADPQTLGIELSVNGQIKQKSTTADMIFTVAQQIRDLSRQITLWPGDVVLTGTPAGVGNGRGEFLKAGDVVSARISGLGELRSVMS